MKIIVLNERTHGDPNAPAWKGVYDDPVTYSKTMRYESSFDAEEKRRIEALLPDVHEIFYWRSLCAPHPIKDYWTLHESVIAGKRFMESVWETYLVGPSLVICCGQKVYGALRKARGPHRDSKWLGELVSDEARVNWFTRVPFPSTSNPQWNSPGVIASCKERLMASFEQLKLMGKVVPNE